MGSFYLQIIGVTSSNYISSICSESAMAAAARSWVGHVEIGRAGVLIRTRPTWIRVRAHQTDDSRRTI